MQISDPDVAEGGDETDDGDETEMEELEGGDGDSPLSPLAMATEAIRQTKGKRPSISPNQEGDSEPRPSCDETTLVRSQ